MNETVLIYATKRQRKQLTRQGIEILTEYEDYVLAQATQAEMAALQANGYEVEIYEAAPATSTVRGVGFAASAPTPQGPPPAEFGPGPHHYVVEFVGPVKSEWLAEIEAHGGRGTGTDAARQLHRRARRPGVRLDHGRPGLRS